MTDSLITAEYATWLKELKLKIRSAQVKATLAASSVLIDFYFDLGKSISEKEIVWGSKFLEQLSRDLKMEFPDMQGFSVTNLKYCRLFYEYIAIRPRVGDETKKPISPPVGDEFKTGLNSRIYQVIRQLPWGHIKLLINKIKETDELLFYVAQTLENCWSRDVMALQIKSNLYARQGKAITNFKNTLPAPQSDLAQQTIKDPYTFDFLTMT